MTDTLLCHSPRAGCCTGEDAAKCPSYTLGPSEMRLCTVTPGEHTFETHHAVEFIVCLKGELVMETEDGGLVQAETGEVIEIPPGVVHRFAPQCAASVMRLTQQAG